MTLSRSVRESKPSWITSGSSNLSAADPSNQPIVRLLDCHSWAPPKPGFAGSNPSVHTVRFRKGTKAGRENNPYKFVFVHMIITKTHCILCFLRFLLFQDETYTMRPLCAKSDRLPSWSPSTVCQAGLRSLQSLMGAGRTVDVAGNGADVAKSLPNPDDHDRNRSGRSVDGLPPLVA
jgi:hypothetical protein